jgi:hypothetical protein
VYNYQYNLAVYFFLLAFSVVYAVFSGVCQRMDTGKRYLLTATIVGGIWLFLFFPYLENPRYLYSTEDVLHYKAIDSALTSLARQGIQNPELEEISSRIELYVSDENGQKTRLEGTARKHGVAEFLPYMEGANYIPLIYRPLHQALVYLSLLCILFIVIFLAIHFLYDPPMPAYHEKLLYFLLLYCVFEAVHFQVFSRIHSYELLLAALAVGRYFSTGVMILFLALFSMRLRFILSIEGKYYESRLSLNSSRVTRWRDSLDNWVLRRFVNSNDLDRRFLVRHDAKNGQGST